MLGFVFFGTLGRYTGWYNMFWSDEISRYCMIWSVFLLAGLSAHRGQMFSIDLISERLPIKGQKIMASIRFLFVSIFSIFCCIYGWEMIQRQLQMKQISPSLKIPMWFMYSIVPFGMLLLLIHYGVLTWQLFHIENSQKMEDR